MMRMQRAQQYVRTSLALFFVAASVGCPQKTAVWIAEGSTARDLVFQIGIVRGQPKAIQFYGMNVYLCASPDQPNKPSLWTVSAARGVLEQDYPTAITYGVVPSGFVEQVPAQTLTKGCYVAAIAGTGAVTFAVDSSGAVTTLLDDGELAAPAKSSDSQPGGVPARM